MIYDGTAYLGQTPISVSDIERSIREQERTRIPIIGGLRTKDIPWLIGGFAVTVGVIVYLSRSKKKK